MKAFTTFINESEDLYLHRHPSDAQGVSRVIDHNTKEIVGHIQTELKPIVKAVGGPDLVPMHTVHAPDGYKGKYESKSFQDINQAKKYAFVQYVLGHNTH